MANQNATNPPEITVVTIESHLRLSKIIPTTPNTNVNGTNNNNANPPRVETILPHPGLHITLYAIRKTTTAPAAQSTPADILPNRITIPF